MIVTGDTTGVADGSWKDLPSAFLCHILAIVPYKRADVKAVCSSWRQAINSSISKVTIPPADLPLLSTLPNIRQLIVQGGRAVPHLQQSQLTAASGAGTSLCAAARWPPSSAVAAAAAGQSNGSIFQPAMQQQEQQQPQQNPNVWSYAVPRMFHQLERLQLLQCEAAVQQLAAWLSSVPRSCSSVLGTSTFGSLRTLEVSSLQCIEALLCALLSQLQQLVRGQCPPGRSSATASSSNSPMALQQLSELVISHTVLSAHCQLSQLLQQLPALRMLQLSGCECMFAVPSGVWQCAGLTKLVLSDNSLITHLDQNISQLQALQELDLSACGVLRTLGPGLSHLTNLTSLNLSGPSGLWLDYSAQDHATTAAAAAAGPSSAVTAASSSSGSAAAVRAALPQLLLPALPHQQQHQMLGDLASLTSLRMLDLSHNRQLMVLPGCVSGLTGLRLLDVRGCGIRWLGDDVLECVGLQELLLGDNVLADIPGAISRLTNLMVLDVGGCCSLWSIPRSLIQMRALERLIIPSKAIGQHVIEQLEMRGSNPVEVIIDLADTDDDAMEDEMALLSDTSYDEDEMESMSE